MFLGPKLKKLIEPNFDLGPQSQNINFDKFLVTENFQKLIF